MKKLLVSSLLIFTFSANAQTYELLRSIDTNDTTSFSLMLNVEDTKSSLNTGYSHTGTMTLSGGSVTFNTTQCVNDVCVNDNSVRNILGVTENQDAVLIEDNEALFGAKTLRIITIAPNIILMETFEDGTVLITEWRQM